MATRFAFGGPRPSAFALALHFSSRSSAPRATTNDSTAVRLPPILSPPAMKPQTPTKHPALRLRGGRRTSLRFAPFLVLLTMKHSMCDCVAIFSETFWDSKSPKGAKNWRHALPSAARARPASATERYFATLASPMATTNDSTPVRLPNVLSPPAMEQQTPTKHPALRLRGGRRTSLRFAPFPVLLQ